MAFRMRIWMAVALVATGCASNPRHDSGTVEDHIRKATHERDTARARLDQYEDVQPTPEGGNDPVGGGAFDPRSSTWRYPDQYYNQQYYLLQSAEKHSRRARVHEEAVVELREAVETQCRDVPPEARASCPSLGPTAGTTEIPGGTRVVFPAGVNVEATAARMRCQVAMAHAYGYRPECPLYMKGVHVAATPDGRAIEITTEHRGYVADLRRRVRQQCDAGHDQRLAR
jgi:hypothetical protein